MTFYKTPTVVQMFELIQIFNQKKMLHFDGISLTDPMPEYSCKNKLLHPLLIQPFKQLISMTTRVP